MIVAIRRRHRGIGDDIEDALAGSDGSAAASYGPQTVTMAPTDSLLVPAFATSSSSAPPVSGTAISAQGNNSSSWDWASIGKFASGLFGIGKPATAIKPVAPSSNTGLYVGLGAAAVLGAVLLMRRRESA